MLLFRIWNNIVISNTVRSWQNKIIYETIFFSLESGTMVQALNDFNQMQVKRKEMEEIITSLDETSDQIKDKCLQFEEVFQYNRPSSDFRLDSKIIFYSRFSLSYFPLRQQTVYIIFFSYCIIYKIKLL